MINSKITTALIIGSLMLSGCGGDDEGGSSTDNATSEAGISIYEGRDFTIQYPRDWEVLESSNYTSNVPPEVVVAFRNNIKDEIFTTNIIVAKTSLNTEISSRDFGKSSISKTKNTLVSFREIASEDSYGSISGYLVDFEGKKSASEPTVNFKSLYFVIGQEGYTVTAAYLPSEDEGIINGVEKSLKFFILN